MAKVRQDDRRSPSAFERVVGRAGVPVAAALAFGGQFLISLRSANPWATIAPGVALYAVALVLVVLALSAAPPAPAALPAPDASEPVSSPEPDGERWLSGRAEWVLLAIVLLGGVWLRLYRIDVIPWGLNNDEAINAQEASEIAAGKPFATVTERGLNRETMFHYLAALSYRNPGVGLNFLRALPVLFGLNPRFINDPMSDALFPLRAVSIGAGSVTLLALYLFGRRQFGRRVALLATLFLAVSPWHLLYSRVGFRVILAPIFALLAIGLFLRARRTGSLFDHLAWGAALGLGFWTYTSIRAVPLAIVVFLAVRAWGARRRGDEATEGGGWRPLLYGAAVTGVLFLGLMAFSGMSPLAFLVRGAYAATPPQSNWLLNFFHAVTMTQYFPMSYAVIQSDAFISDGVSATYGLIGLEPDTLLMAAFATLGLFVAAGMARRGRGAAGATSAVADAALLMLLVVLCTWLTVGWLGPSLTRLLPLLPWLALCAALLLVRVWDDLAAIRPPLTAFAAVALMVGVAGLATAQGFSNLFLLAGRSERAMQHFGATQTIMGMFVRTLPPDQDVVILHTLRVDTLKFLVGGRPRVQLVTDTRHVSLDEIVKTPRTVTFVVEYARPFAEPLRALMTRFPLGDMSQIADARVDPDKQIFFTFTLWKDAAGNIVPAPGSEPGMAPPPGDPGMSFPGAELPVTPPPPS